MRTKKRVLIAIIFSILLTGCTERYPEHPDYILTAEQTGYFSSTLNSGELWEQFGLTLKLSPKSGELMPIYLMTCSWTDLTYINDPNIDLGTSCDANFMTWISLDEDEYLELTTIAQSRLGYNPTSSKFRIAIIAIDTTEFDFAYYLTNSKAESYLDSLKSQQDRFIWSNEIQLKRIEKQEIIPSERWEKKKASNK